MSYRHLNPTLIPGLLVLSLSFLIVACEPRVKVEAPDKPIVINLNVKIQHEVRVRVEKDVDQLLNQNSNLF